MRATRVGMGNRTAQVSHSALLAIFTPLFYTRILPSPLDTDDYYLLFNFLSAPPFDTLS